MRPYPGGVTSNNKATLLFPEDTFALSAGASKSIEVTIKAPIEADNFPSDLLPVYSGYIQINGSNGDKLKIPYQGLNTDLHADIPIWSKEREPYPLATSYNYDRVLLPGSPLYTFTFVNANDAIELIGYNTYGSDEQRIDVCS